MECPDGCYWAELAPAARSPAVCGRISALVGQTGWAVLLRNPGAALVDDAAVGLSLQVGCHLTFYERRALCCL